MRLISTPNFYTPTSFNTVPTNNTAETNNSYSLAAGRRRPSRKLEQPKGNYGRPTEIPHKDPKGTGPERIRPTAQPDRGSSYFTALPAANSPHWQSIAGQKIRSEITVPIKLGSGETARTLEGRFTFTFSPKGVDASTIANIVQRQNPRDWPGAIDAPRDANGSLNQRVSLLGTAKTMNTIVVTGIDPKTGQSFESSMAFRPRIGRNPVTGEAETRLYVGLNTNGGPPEIGMELFKAVARYAKANGYVAIETIRDTKATIRLEGRLNPVVIVDNRTPDGGGLSPQQQKVAEDRNLPPSQKRIRPQDYVAAGAVRHRIPMDGNPAVDKLLRD
jgi:hypothetical protein